MTSKLVLINRTAQMTPPGLKVQARRLWQSVSYITKQSWGEVAVVLVEPSVSRQLNLVYRHHNWVTDVLSFTYESKPQVSGELIICLSQAIKQAKRRHWSLKKELELLLVHGYLHLLGYDHIKPGERLIMRRTEQQVIKH